MTKPFDTDTKNYASKQVAQTPYQRAKQAWDMRLGSLVNQAKNWRLMAIINGAIGLMLLILLISTLITTKHKQLFIAEVTATGQIKNVALLKTAYEPTLAQKEYFVSQFIKMIRDVPLDPVAAKKEWTSAYYFLSQRAARKLNQQWQENNPMNALGKQTTTVEVENVDPITNDTFNVTWKETTVLINGTHALTKTYSGVFTTTVVQPKSQEQIMKNPLGIYIVDFNFSAQQRQ
jgi:type IV secretion system protein TrbF